MKGFNGSVFARLVLLALAVVCAFVAASYKTPVAVAVGTGLVIAGLAAAPLEVGGFLLCTSASVFEGVRNVADAGQHFSLYCAGKLAPHLVSQHQDARHTTTSCFGDEDHHVLLELKGFPGVSDGAARKMVLHAYDACRELQAMSQAAAALDVTPTNQINAHTTPPALAGSAA